jgi:hypothetical protein
MKLSKALLKDDSYLLEFYIENYSNTVEFFLVDTLFRRVEVVDYSITTSGEKVIAALHIGKTTLDDFKKMTENLNSLKKDNNNESTIYLHIENKVFYIKAYATGMNRNPKNSNTYIHIYIPRRK